jgi:hypothetical protein
MHKPLGIFAFTNLVREESEWQSVSKSPSTGAYVGFLFSCYSTPNGYGADALDRLAHLFNRASLHAIDRFFMLVRRRLRLLERPISPTRRARRVWHGYAPYDPAMVGKCLDIFRVWYNWCFIGEDGLTPAERLGVAKGKVRMEDIVYFDPNT